MKVGTSARGGLLLALPLLAACAGGPGSIGGGDFGYDAPPSESTDPPPLSTDTPTVDSDAPASGGESAPPGSGGGAAPPGSGGGGFACSGNYTCTASAQGQTVTFPIVLSRNGGDCVATGGPDNETVTFTSDGKILDKDGNEQATWESNGAGLTISSDGISFTCTPG